MFSPKSLAMVLSPVSSNLRCAAIWSAMVWRAKRNQ